MDFGNELSFLRLSNHLQVIYQSKTVHAADLPVLLLLWKRGYLTKWFCCKMERIDLYVQHAI